MQLPNGQMQLVQPMMRPAMAIAAPHPHPALMGGNLIRTPGGIPGMPAGILGPMQAIPMPGMPGAIPGMGMMLPGNPVLQMMPRFR
ncbi:hypothetical protein DOY81_013379 [Sarcophaga bullata]|nr:hypothetical protein DOY81_013379 [Sarcophaga bullata]